MGKHKGRRRKFRRYIKGILDELMVPATLAARTLAATNTDETVNERTFVSSIVARWSIDNMTPLANAGPLMVGIAHGDYTAAEIEQFIENTGSWDEGDLVNQEVAKRKIKIVGVFADQEGTTSLSIMVLNNGKPIKTKCKWVLNQGTGLKTWVYNLGSVDISGTSAPNIHVEGHANLWPL